MLKDMLMEEETQYKEVLKAVESGDKAAKTKLAWYKLSGRGNAEINVDGAVALLQERVKDNDSDAMWMLGLCHEYGMGCEQDFSMTEALYCQSCECKNVVGKYLWENGKKTRGHGVVDIRGLFFFFFFFELFNSFILINSLSFNKQED